jgi:hypothetical protein
LTWKHINGSARFVQEREFRAAIQGLAIALHTRHPPLTMLKR